MPGKVILDKEQLRELYIENKLSSINTAKLLGVAPRTVINRLRDNRIPVRPRKTEINESEVLELYQKIKNVLLIAKRLGVSSERVYAVLDKHNVNRIRRMKTPPLSESQLREFYIEQRMGRNTIARVTGLSQNIIKNLIRRYNIPTRSLSEAGRIAWETGRFAPAKGGITKDGDGRILVRDKNSTRKRHYTLRSHLVWEQVHNRPLPKGYVIHHLNGVKDDDRPENLIALPKGKHDKVIPDMAKRIRELEAKIKLLERALESQQLIWWSEN